MKKLEIGPHADYRTPDGEPKESWDTLDSAYAATYRVAWGDGSLLSVIPAEHYDRVHASHVLEHLPWWRTRSALSDVFGILKPGGKFTVWVPDAVKIIQLAMEDPARLQELEQDWKCGRAPLGTIDNLNPDKDPWVYMNARVFWGARPGELGQEQHFHRAMFGEESLSRLLVGAGFSRVARIERDTTVDPGHGWMEVGMEGFK